MNPAVTSGRCRITPRLLVMCRKRFCHCGHLGSRCARVPRNATTLTILYPTDGAHFAPDPYRPADQQLPRLRTALHH